MFYRVITEMRRAAQNILAGCVLRTPDVEFWLLASEKECSCLSPSLHSLLPLFHFAYILFTPVSLPFSVCFFLPYMWIQNSDVLMDIKYNKSN